MDILDRTIQHKAMWWAGLAVAAAIVVAVVVGQTSGPRQVVSDAAAYIDNGTGPCPPERWELACRRMVDAGWACMTGPGGVPVVELDPVHCPEDSASCRGGHGEELYRDRIGIVAHACGDADPTPEHEIAHVLGLSDCSGCPAGDLMAEWPRTGLRIPQRVSP